MEQVFLHVVNMSISASFVIAAVLVVRLLLRRAPRCRFILWAIVGLRLLLPFSIPVRYSPLPVRAEALPADLALAPSPQLHTGIAPLDRAVSASLPAAAPGDSANPMQILLAAGTVLWLVGIAALLIWDAVSLLFLRRRLEGAALREDGIYAARGIPSPFVWGIVRPRIYMPAESGEAHIPWIAAHERAHIRRGDPLWKMIGCAALTLHWFNPLVWFAYALFTADMEEACDAAVLHQSGEDDRCAYSEALLAAASGKRSFAMLPPAFGESGAKRRIRRVLDYRRPTRFAAAAAVVLTVLVSVGCAFSLSDAEKTKEFSVTFPAYQGGRRDYNAAIYDTPPFTMTVRLPADWTVVVPPEDEQGMTLPFTQVMFQKDGETVGHVGFNIFELYEGVERTDENFYRMVYNQLLGNDVTWDCEYTPVVDTETFCAATCFVDAPVWEDGKVMAEMERCYYPAVVAFDTDMLVYVAMDFGEDVLPEGMHRQIAESVRLTRN